MTQVILVDNVNEALYLSHPYFSDKQYSLPFDVLGREIGLSLTLGEPEFEYHRGCVFRRQTANVHGHYAATANHE